MIKKWYLGAFMGLCLMSPALANEMQARNLVVKELKIYGKKMDICNPKIIKAVYVPRLQSYLVLYEGAGFELGSLECKETDVMNGDIAQVAVRGNHLSLKTFYFLRQFPFPSDFGESFMYITDIRYNAQKDYLTLIVSDMGSTKDGFITLRLSDKKVIAYRNVETF